jgi:hypothetical protein
MKDYLNEIYEKFPVRRNEEQKKCFFEYVKAEAEGVGLSARVEALEKKHNNIVIGDVDNASVVYTAHYDTPARSLLPNLMMPRNPGFGYLYAFGIPLLIAFASLGVAYGVQSLFGLPYAAFVIIYLVLYFGVFFGILRCGDNKTNKNDNTSGVATVLSIMANNPTGAAYILFDNEEQGLLGSKAYCETHGEELDKCVLCINLDMIGCIMGHFGACCTSETKLVDYISYMGLECGFPVSTHQGVYSSDSTPFSDKGVPSVSFARHAPSNTGTIHNSYDTKALLTADQIEKDSIFITKFADRMANAVLCPVAREIPDKVKEKLDVYLCRKRAPKA